MSRQRGISGAD